MGWVRANDVLTCTHTCIARGCFVLVFRILVVVFSFYPLFTLLSADSGAGRSIKMQVSIDRRYIS